MAEHDAKVASIAESFSLVEGVRAGPTAKRTAVFATFYLFLAYVGGGLSGAPTTHMFLIRACLDHGLDADACNKNSDVDPCLDVDACPFSAAQSEAVNKQTVAKLSGDIAQLLTCAFLGMLGDARGRRVVLLCPLLGSMLSALALALLPADAESTTLPILNFFAGILGGQYVCNHVVFSTLADVTRGAAPEVRSSAFGMVEAALWAGLLVGPILGGLIATEVGDQPTFFVPAFIFALNFLVTFVGYPETLEESRRKPIEWWRANPFVSLSMYTENRTTMVFGIMTLFALAALAGGGPTEASYAFYVSGGMSSLQLGLLSGASGGATMVGLLFLMPLMMRCISMPRIMQISQCNAMVCSLAISMSGQLWQLYTFTSLMLTSACFFPIVRSGFCNVFGELRYGEALAAVGVVEQIAALIGAPIFQTIYVATKDATLGPFRSIAMLCVAGFCFVAVISSFVPLPKTKGEFPEAFSSTVSGPALLDAPLPLAARGASLED